VRAFAGLDRIYAMVAEIPPGRVATYGQVAELAGLPGRARLVGFALSRLPEDSAVPWHRVVNARGEVSDRRAPSEEKEQRLLLEEEGVVFDRHGRIPLAVYCWEG
jgi:methylated-DNA-protein-cysteine methyltransferase-like protein